MKLANLTLIVLLTSNAIVGCNSNRASIAMKQLPAAVTKDPYYAPPAPAGTLALSVALDRVVRFPKSSNSHFQLGAALYSQRDFAHAAHEFEQAITISPSQPKIDAYFYLGYTYEALGRSSDALHVFEEMRSKKLSKKENSRLFLCLGNCYWDKHSLDLAREYYGKSVAADAGQGAAYFGLGCIAAYNGDKDRAFKHFKSAISNAKTDHAEAQAHAGMGKLLEERGDSKRAESEYKRALSLDPDNKWAIVGAQRLKD